MVSSWNEQQVRPAQIGTAVVYAKDNSKKMYGQSMEPALTGRGCLGGYG